jgi:hypothetical protein
MKDKVVAFAKGPTRGPKPMADRSPNSRNAPEGHLRLLINLREDLHLRLKIQSAKTRTPVGQILARLVEDHVPEV